METVYSLYEINFITFLFFDYKNNLCIRTYMISTYVIST